LRERPRRAKGCSQRVHRVQARCRPTRHRRTRCRQTGYRRPGCSRDAGIASSPVVTHGGCTSIELGRNVSATLSQSKEIPDESPKQSVQSHSHSTIARCSFCGRVLPPLARLRTWRGSG
jgi:hypothetical protein